MRWRSRAVRVWLVVVLAPMCRAQRLDLGTGPAAPHAGEGRAALALAELLEAEAGRLERDDARRAVRQLAAGLLRDGEHAGPAGSEALLAGLTLAAKRDELDGLLRGNGDASRGYIVGVVEQTERSITPRGVDLLLRDALSPLIGEVSPGCGWGPLGEDDLALRLVADTAVLHDLQDNRHLTDQASAVLAEMVSRFDAALGEPAYLRDAAGWAALLSGAALALDEPPVWLDMSSRDRLRADLSAGVSMCLERPGEAREHLSRTAALVGVVAATRDLEASRQSRELRDAVNRLVSAAEGDPTRDPAAVARIAETYARALERVTAVDRLPAPDELVRQIRPMLGPLTDAHRGAADAVAMLLPRILGEADPTTDPAVLAAMGSLATVTADLAIPGAVSGLLSGWVSDPTRPDLRPSKEPMATREMGPLAERVRQLGVSLSREAEHDEALSALRGLASMAAIAPELPGERELLGAGSSSAWRRVTGDQVGRLVYLVDQARTDWARSVAIEQFADRREADEARLRALAAVLPLLRDAAAVERMGADWSREIAPAVNGHPGWELTPEGLAVLAGSLPRRAAGLAARLARGDDFVGASAEAGQLRAEFAAALACARLEARCRALGAAGCGAAAELGMGAPGEDAWMGGQRRAMASLCRSAFEAAAADETQRAAFVSHANRMGEALLHALP